MTHDETITDEDYRKSPVSRPDLKNIKDQEPNQELIEFLEGKLADAKSGKLRTVIAICGWFDDQATHGWSIDRRNSQRRILAELIMLEHDFVVQLGLREGDSILAENLDWN